MIFYTQSAEDILKSMQELRVSWRDEVAERIIEAIKKIEPKEDYDEGDIKAILELKPFADAILIVRLFLGLSKDEFESRFSSEFGKRGSVGIKKYNQNPDRFIKTLRELGLCAQMKEIINREPHWSDVLVERLRSGRGSAIKGQARGRSFEDSVEDIVRSVFSTYKTRVSFVGLNGNMAKCDFAIPNGNKPNLIIEAKAFGATGSKQTDIIGDIEKIINAKPHTMIFLLCIDGDTWNRRMNDLKKIVGYQNNGYISRIYTKNMFSDLKNDLETIKSELGLS